MPVPESQVRDLLAAISDALDPPAPAHYDGRWPRRELLEQRAAYITGSLRSVVNGEAPPWAATKAIRGLHALMPLPYEPEPEGGES